MIKLKELVKLYKEMDFKSQKAFQKYAAKHKMRKTTKVTIGGKETTAGDAAKNSKPKKSKKDWDKHAQDAASDANAKMDAAEKELTKKSDKEAKKIEKNMMNAADAANAKMDAAEWLSDKDSIESFNKMAQDGEPVQFDTDDGRSLTWGDGMGGMFNSVIATDEDGAEVEVRFDDIVRFDKGPQGPLSGKEELAKWEKADKEAMDKYGDYIEKHVAGDADNRVKMDDAAKKRLARDLMRKDFAIPGTEKAKKRSKKLAKSMGLKTDSYNPNVISMVDLITERISSDIESAAKKAGFKFKKITNDITTNKFSNPKGDIKKMGSDAERVRMNSWMSDEKNVTKANYTELGEKFIKELKRKYKLIKYDKMGSGVYAKFMKDKKNPRTEFVIQYAKSMAGPYISYTGVYGE